MKRKIGGYFTVEAVLVLPIAIMIIVMVIYLMIFQYNRCLMEHDMGILALRGTALQAEDAQERIEKLRVQADLLYKEKYVAWDMGDISLKWEKGTVCVECEGQLQFPFSGGVNGSDRIWKSTAVVESHMTSPVSFIRNCRKLTGGQ